MRLIVVFLLFLLSLGANAQLWKPVDQNKIEIKGIRAIQPRGGLAVQIDDSNIKSLLWQTRKEGKLRREEPLIPVMLYDGTIDQFDVVQYEIMEERLAAKYPNIKTFHGRSISNPLRTIRIDYTTQGFRAVISEVDQPKTYIDHYQRSDKTHRIIYRKKDLSNEDKWTCDVHEHDTNLERKVKHAASRMAGDCEFRTYRLAMTTTGEYSNYHGATSASQSDLVLSAVVTTMNRVNEVYEQDITVRMILIDNTDELFYYDPATDPYTNSPSLPSIHNNIVNIIGSNNFDVGHCVDTGGGGYAYLRAVCNNNIKGGGYTGRNVPEGDPFDIDYVAHELGHQFGGNHTQNNSCNRNPSTAIEPGSASTIMGYAGICSPNVQSNSDAYFHAISIEEMKDHVDGTNCAEIINGFNNVAPDITPLSDKTIPINTPFKLETVVTDPDGDPMTYCWEQIDNEVGNMPPQSTNTQGPMFRSLFYNSNPERYFPSIDNVNNGTSDTWEVLPSVTRDMDFRLTVRDLNDANGTYIGGCTSEIDVRVSTTADAGPFVVTSQNTATTWLETATYTITWDVANTDVAPVSCANVDILLSYDGGDTFTTILVSDTPNDGNQTITVPVGTTNTARVMVRCSDNFFYDMNDEDIIIDTGVPSFEIQSQPTNDEICEGENSVFTVNSISVLGFNNPITLSLSNNPPGSTVTISPNPILPGQSSQVTITNIPSSGTYNMIVSGVSGLISKQTSFDLDVLIAPTTSPGLVSPADMETGVSLNPTLSWNNVVNATDYTYELYTTPGGNNIVESGMVNDVSVTINTPLLVSSTYYWRVKASNICGESVWSEERSFVTATCLSFNSTDVPKAISASGTPTINSVLNIQDKGVITDINVVDLVGTHTWVGDINVDIIAPDDTSLDLWDDPCDNGVDDFDINFDDEAASSNYPCPPTDGGTYQPDNPLSIFDNKQMQGAWTLSIFDDFNQDGGSLDGWGIRVCLDEYCDLTVNQTASSGQGTLSNAISCAQSGDTIWIDQILIGQEINLIETQTIDKAIVIYSESGVVNILSESSTSAFDITNTGELTLHQLSLENLETTEGVIENSGILRLQSVEISSATGEKTIQNEAGGSVIVENNVSLTDQ